MSNNSVTNVASDLISLLERRQYGVNNIASDLLTLISADGSASPNTVQARTGSSAVEYLSEVEECILRNVYPIEVNETEELTILGQRGLWINKAEVDAWRGDLNITEYSINEDQNPQIITKRVEQVLEYVQELAVRYLRPPTPPAPGEIVITQEADFRSGPAPPLIIRQQPARAATPEPLVVREAPPAPPPQLGVKRIAISGRRLPPPPRKVVIERLAPLPAKPQNVIVERWLPYAAQRRRVLFNRAAEVRAEVAAPRNVIVQWTAPAVNVTQEVKHLGVIRANPAEYVQRYGSSLKMTSALPQFVLDIPTPRDIGTLAADFRYRSVLELEGALEGFKYVDLDAEGLSEYRSQLIALGIRDLGGSLPVAAVSKDSSTASDSSFAFAAEQIFDMIDADGSGYIGIDEAERVALRMNTRLNRSYGEVDVKAFFAAVSGDSDLISKKEFVKVFESMTR